MAEINRPGHEKPTEFLSVRFHPEAREGLLQRGYTIYSLTGASIDSHRKAGRSFMSTWHQSHPALEALPSMKNREVAINVVNPYLPESNEKTLSEQLALINKHSAALMHEVPGTAAIMGEAADYIEIVFLHFDATAAQDSPQFLFGKDKGWYRHYARSKTKVDNADVAGVGRFHPARGLSVYHWPADGRIPTVFAVPLIVPHS
jgi:hypothetical protein